MNLFLIILSLLIVSADPLVWAGPEDTKESAISGAMENDWRKEVLDIEAQLREEAKKKKLNKTQLAGLFHSRAEEFLRERKSAVNNASPKKAIELFGLEIKERPSAAAYHSRGRAYLRVLDYQSAIADMSKALEMAKPEEEISFGIPAIPEILRGRGRIYSKKFYLNKNKSDYDRALADYTESLKAGAGKAEFTRVDRAQLYFLGGGYKEAAADLQLFMASNVSARDKKSLASNLCLQLGAKGYPVSGCPNAGVEK